MGYRIHNLLSSSFLFTLQNQANRRGGSESVRRSPGCWPHGLLKELVSLALNSSFTFQTTWFQHGASTYTTRDVGSGFFTFDQCRSTASTVEMFPLLSIVLVSCVFSLTSCQVSTNHPWVNIVETNSLSGDSFTDEFAAWNNRYRQTARSLLSSKPS